MENKRYLYDKLITICPNVYFNPPETVKLNYPCFICNLSDIKGLRADDKRYLGYERYTLTYITRDYADETPYTVLNDFEYSAIERIYSADHLHHYVLTLFIRRNTSNETRI